MARISRKSIRQRRRLGLTIKRTLIAAGLASGLAISMTFSAFALPVDAGGHTNATVEYPGSNHVKVKMDQGAGKTADINWTSYNLWNGETAEYYFPSVRQTANNWINANSGISHIHGNITTTGAGAASSSVVLINPNGFIFDGANLINVNSLTATTNPPTSINGREYTFERLPGSSGASIIFDGNTQISGTSDVAFIANAIWMKKNAKITAPDSKVQLVTADGVTFQYGTDGSIPDINNSHIYRGDSSLVGFVKNVFMAKDSEIKADNVRIVAKRNQENPNFKNNKNSNVEIKGKIMADAASVGEDGSIVIYASNDHSDGAEVNIAEAELNAGDTGSVEVASDKITTSKTTYKDDGYRSGWDWNTDWQEVSNDVAYIKGGDVTLRTNDFTDMSKAVYKPARNILGGIKSDMSIAPDAPELNPTIETDKLVATRFETMSEIGDSEITRIVTLADSAKDIQLGDSAHLAPISGTSLLDLAGDKNWEKTPENKSLTVYTTNDISNTFNIENIRYFSLKEGSASANIEKANRVLMHSNGELILTSGNLIGSLKIGKYDNSSTGSLTADVNQVKSVSHKSSGNMNLDADYIGSNWHKNNNKEVVRVTNGSADINVANGTGDVDGNVKVDTDGTFDLAANDIGGDLDVSSTYGTNRGDSGVINVNDVDGQIITHGGQADSLNNGDRFIINANSANGVQAYGLNNIDITNHAGDIYAGFKSIVSTDTANYVKTNWDADVTVNEADDVFANNGSKVTINTLAQDLLARGGAVIDAVNATVDSILSYGTSDVSANIVNNDVTANHSSTVNAGTIKGNLYTNDTSDVTGSTVEGNVVASNSGQLVVDDPNVDFGLVKGNVEAHNHAIADVDTIEGNVDTYDYSKVISSGNTVHGDVNAYDHSTVDADTILGTTYANDYSKIITKDAQDIYANEHSTIFADLANNIIGSGNTTLNIGQADLVSFDGQLLTLNDLDNATDSIGQIKITNGDAVVDINNVTGNIDYNANGFLDFTANNIYRLRVNNGSAVANINEAMNVRMYSDGTLDLTSTGLVGTLQLGDDINLIDGSVTADLARVSKVITNTNGTLDLTADKIGGSYYTNNGIDVINLINGSGTINVTDGTNLGNIEGNILTQSGTDFSITANSVDDVESHGTLALTAGTAGDIESTGYLTLVSDVKIGDLTIAGGAATADLHDAGNILVSNGELTTLDSTGTIENLTINSGLTREANLVNAGDILVNGGILRRLDAFTVDDITVLSSAANDQLNGYNNGENWSSVGYNGNTSVYKVYNSGDITVADEGKISFLRSYGTLGNIHISNGETVAWIRNVGNVTVDGTANLGTLLSWSGNVGNVDISSGSTFINSGWSTIGDISAHGNGEINHIYNKNGLINSIDIQNGSTIAKINDVTNDVLFDSNGTFNMTANDIGGDLDVSSTYGTNRGDSGVINVNDITGQIITHGGQADSKHQGERFDITANSANGVEAYGVNNITVNNHAGEINAGFKSIVSADTADDVNTGWGADVTVNEADDVFANNGSKVTINTLAQDLLARGGAVIDAVNATVDSILSYGTSDVSANIVNNDVTANHSSTVNADTIKGNLYTNDTSDVTGSTVEGNVVASNSGQLVVDDPNVDFGLVKGNVEAHNHAIADVDTIEGNVNTHDYSKVISSGNTVHGDVTANDYSTVEADVIDGNLITNDYSKASGQKVTGDIIANNTGQDVADQPNVDYELVEGDLTANNSALVHIDQIGEHSGVGNLFATGNSNVYAGWVGNNVIAAGPSQVYVSDTVGSTTGLSGNVMNNVNALSGSYVDVSGSVGNDVTANGSTVLAGSVGNNVNANNSSLVTVTGSVGNDITSDDSIVSADSVGNDVWAYSESYVDVAGAVDNNLTAEDSEVHAGSVGQNVNANNSYVDVSGHVGNNLTAIYNSEIYAGSVGQDVNAFNSYVDVDGSVGNDIETFSSEVHAGSVGNNVDASDNSDIYVYGNVGNDVDAFNSYVDVDGSVGNDIDATNSEVYAGSVVNDVIADFNSYVDVDGHVGNNIDADNSEVHAGSVGIDVDAFDSNVYVYGNVGNDVEAVGFSIVEVDGAVGNDVDAIGKARVQADSVGNDAYANGQSVIDVTNSIGHDAISADWSIINAGSIGHDAIATGWRTSSSNITTGYVGHNTNASGTAMIQVNGDVGNDVIAGGSSWTHVTGDVGSRLTKGNVLASEQSHVIVDGNSGEGVVAVDDSTVTISGTEFVISDDTADVFTDVVGWEHDKDYPTFTKSAKTALNDASINPKDINALVTTFDDSTVNITTEAGNIESYGTSNVNADNADVGTILAEDQSEVYAASSGSVIAGNNDDSYQSDVTASVDVDTINGDVNSYDKSTVVSSDETITGNIWAYDHSTVEAGVVNGTSNAYDEAMLDLGTAKDNIYLFDGADLIVDNAWRNVYANSDGRLIEITAGAVDGDIFAGYGIDGREGEWEWYNDIYERIFDDIFRPEMPEGPRDQGIMVMDGPPPPKPRFPETGNYDITVNDSVNDIFAKDNVRLDVNEARFLVFNGGDLVIDRLNATAAFASGDSIAVRQLHLGKESLDRQQADIFNALMEGDFYEINPDMETLEAAVNGVGYLQSDNFDFHNSDVEAKVLMLARFAQEGKDKAFDFTTSEFISGDQSMNINHLVVGAPDVKEAYRYYDEDFDWDAYYSFDEYVSENPLVALHEELGIPEFVMEGVVADSFYYDGDILAGQDAYTDPETGELVPAEYMDFGGMNLYLLTKGDVDMNVSGVDSLTALLPNTLDVEANDNLGINAILTQYDASLKANSFSAVPMPILIGNDDDPETGLLKYSSIFSMAGPVSMESISQPVEFVSYDQDGFFGRGTSVITFGEGEDLQFFDVTGNFTPVASLFGAGLDNFNIVELERQAKAGVVSGLNRQIPEIQNNTVPVDLRPAGAAASIEIEEEDKEKK